jgi:hypothetical protein
MTAEPPRGAGALASMFASCLLPSRGGAQQRHRANICGMPGTIIIKNKLTHIKRGALDVRGMPLVLAMLAHGTQGIDKRTLMHIMKRGYKQLPHAGHRLNRDREAAPAGMGLPVHVAPGTLRGLTSTSRALVVMS